MVQIGKTLIVAAAVMGVVGLGLMFSDRVPVFRYLGKLPGDFRWSTGNGTFYFPLTTCILLSVIASAIAWVIRKL